MDCWRPDAQLGTAGSSISIGYVFIAGKLVLGDVAIDIGLQVPVRPSHERRLLLSAHRLRVRAKSIQYSRVGDVLGGLTRYPCWGGGGKMINTFATEVLDIEANSMH